MLIKELALKLKLIFLPCKGNEYRPKFLNSRFLAYYAVFLLVLKIFLIPFLIYFPKTVFFAEITRTALIAFANEERMLWGSPSLQESSKLNEAAYLKAQDMIGKDYFAHYCPQGTSPWYWFQRVGYNYRFAGENLAIGFLDSQQVHRAWMASPSHQKNILNPNFKETGIAVVRGKFEGKEVVLAVQLFGTLQEPILIPEEPIIISEEPIIIPEDPVLIPQIPISEEEVNEEISEVLAEEEEEKEEFAFLPEEGKDIALFLFQFTALRYSDLLQKLIYASLILVIASLLIVIIFDFFVYQKFEIDHKDIVFNAIGFIFLLLVFLYIDKENVIQLIPHNFQIY